MRSLTFCAICLLAVAAGVGGLRGAQRLGRGEGAWAYAGHGQDPIRQAARRGVGLMRVRLACGRVLWRRLRVSPRFQ